MTYHIFPTEPSVISIICRALHAPVRHNRQYWSLQIGEKTYYGFYSEEQAEKAARQLTND